MILIRNKYGLMTSKNIWNLQIIENKEIIAL